MLGQIKYLIYSNFSVIDVECKTVLRIDVSSKNIKKASSNHLKNPNHKFSFKQITLDQLTSGNNERFDIAVMTYVIHEVDENERINLIN